MKLKINWNKFSYVATFYNRIMPIIIYIDNIQDLLHNHSWNVLKNIKHFPETKTYFAFVSIIRCEISSELLIYCSNTLFLFLYFLFIYLFSVHMNTEFFFQLIIIKKYTRLIQGSFFVNLICNVNLFYVYLRSSQRMCGI